MSLSIISFTEQGTVLAGKIARIYHQKQVALYTKCSLYQGQETGLSFVKESIREWAGEQMAVGNALLFIGACGIAVRAISPYVADKFYDSPVLVMDEKGQYIIPVLSGHMGGANEMAKEIAEKMGVVPVITTATDLNQKFAVDLFAKRNGFHIANREGIAKVSAKVLSGQEITISVETGHIDEAIVLPDGIRLVPYPPMQPVDILVTTEEIEGSCLILLIPKTYIIGMGCKKGKDASQIEGLIGKSMENAGILKSRIFALASIDRKKEEEGLVLWSRKARVPFVTFSAEQLQEVEGDFKSSDFVKEQVGVENVCERAALKACGQNGTLILEKCAEDGMTIAIAKREWRVSFGQE